MMVHTFRTGCLMKSEVRARWSAVDFQHSRIGAVGSRCGWTATDREHFWKCWGVEVAVFSFFLLHGAC